MVHSSVWRMAVFAGVLFAATGCLDDLEDPVGPPITGFEPGVVLEASGGLRGSIVISEETALALRTPRQWVNPGWVFEGARADQTTWSGSLVIVARGPAEAGSDWSLFQPTPGEEWEDEESDIISMIDEGTAYLVLNYSGTYGDMSLLSVSGTVEVAKTSDDWIAGYITVSMIEQIFETGEIPENAREATLEGTFNVKISTMGEI